MHFYIATQKTSKVALEEKKTITNLGGSGSALEFCHEKSYETRKFVILVDESLGTSEFASTRLLLMK